MLKKNKKTIFGIIVGLILGTVITCGATILVASSNVNYDNSNSGIQLNGNDADNVQKAIDALHADVSSRSPVSICKTGYAKGLDYGSYYDCIPQTYAITSGYKCVRASWLHKEECTQTSGCYSDGYYSGGNMNTNMVTYGKLGTVGENLEVGDAFDCDVNGNGYIDVDENGYSTERFYYVSPRWTPGTDISDTAFDVGTAVLIYYSNTNNGLITMSGGSYAIKADIQEAYPNETISTYDNIHGPVSARKKLPTTSMWSNVTLSTTTRAIIACNDADCSNPSTSTSGGTTQQEFSYAGYAARLLTILEIKKAGCDTLSGITGLGTAGALKACNFLMERTRYTVNNAQNPTGIWLENPRTTNSISAFELYVFSSRIEGDATYYDNGVRPVIEVPVSQILK